MDYHLSFREGEEHYFIIEPREMLRVHINENSRVDLHASTIGSGRYAGESMMMAYFREYESSRRALEVANHTNVYFPYSNEVTNEDVSVHMQPMARSGDVPVGVAVTIKRRDPHGF